MRLSFLAVAAAVLAAGCNSSGGGSAADVSDIANGDPFEQVSYNVGFQSGQQFLQTDSSFNYDRFSDGFNRGLEGDSVEIAYALGLQYGLQVRQDSLGAIDKDIFLAGLQAALRGDTVLTTPEQFQRAQAIVEDSLEMRRLRASAATNPQAAQRLNALRTNAVTADSFLTAARGLEGATVLEDGVVSITTSEGDGPSPSPGDRVRVVYQGQFADGTVFDESGEEGATFSVEQVVPGFRTALLDMNVGETRTVYLPPDQAYGVMGQQGPGGQGGIPPNSALQFELTLVEIVPASAQPQLPPGFGQ
ncbi:FKBP-type peptidyl-prolyl cis-trans isomerase [Rubrivirga sp.]|uniref:FKBP-type peptidyl-prolyl cis-trans isomerase n=1 Tax=Rubrivirga sp. TaxID=1885344 RepID=UPI003C76B80D